MVSQSIHPQPMHIGAADASADWCSVYDITASDALPLLAVARSMRSVWLRGGAERVYARFTRRWKAAFIGSFAIGFAATWVVLVLPARVGRWIALAASLAMVPMSVVYFLLLRYDVVCLVVRTYEYWFFSVGNVVSAVLLAVHLGDMRAAMAFSLWFQIQNNLLTDASTVFSRGYISSAIVVLLFTLVLMATIAWGVIDDTRDVELVRLDTTRVLRIQDALLHGYSTQAILLLRNIFRRWTARTQQHGASTIVCVTLRARVKLRLVDSGPAATVLEVVPRLEASVSQTDDAGMPVQMQLVPIEACFVANNTTFSVVKCVLSTASTPQRKAIRSVLLTIAYTGLSLTVVGAVVPSLPYANEIRVGGFACSLVFVAFFMTSTQRQLLRRLVFSFDFAFLSVQILVVHVCLCDVLGWGYASLPVATIWLWIQWVFTGDAATPVARVKWGIRRRLPAIIMVVFIVSQILIFVTILGESGAGLRNRVVLSFSIHGHGVEMKVIPMLLSRMVILFCWSWKVLWRMWTIRSNELLMIQGSMTYVNAHRQRIAKAPTIPAEATAIAKQ